jgi:hypothetical protein
MTDQFLSTIVSNYQPYHLYPAFTEGRKAYARGEYRNPHMPDCVEAQAWDRGVEAEMCIQRLREKYK